MKENLGVSCYNETNGECVSAVLAEDYFADNSLLQTLKVN